MLTIYCGASASGKTTLADTMLAFNPYMKSLVTYTTRPQRIGEVNGRDYNFVTHDEFQNLIETGSLTEYRTYETLVGGKKEIWFYGSPKIDPDIDTVGVLDINGIKSFLQAYGSADIRIIFVKTDPEVREARAKVRGSFDKTEWNRRLKDDEVKFSEEALQELANIYGKPIKVINNSGRKPTFSEIRPERS